jgi:hypothetical protein
MFGLFKEGHPLVRLLTRLLFSIAIISVGFSNGNAQCPSLTNHGWAQRATIRFFLDATLNDEQKRQIRAATGEWSRANTINNSRVHFVEDTSGQSFNLKFLTGALPQGNPARFDATYNAATGTIVAATITYDPNNTFPGTSILIADPALPGYGTIVMKLILHEMGHLMGLDHPVVPPNPCDQQDNATVMNYSCGINDQGNNIPTMVSACDQSSINLESIYPTIQETSNPIDDNYFFVRQQYLDFLDREPEPEGFNYWTNILNGCGTDPSCLNSVRIEISSRFFIELEFQRTGFYVIRLWQAAYGRFPTFSEFMIDRRQVQNTDESRALFASNFVQRSSFTSIYGGLSNTDYVNKLFDSAGLTPYGSERAAEIQALNSGTKTRAQVLQDVVEIPEFKNRYYNLAFIRLQYYGYLRRNADSSGEAYWIDVLTNRSPNNYQAMICAFINSSEYQLRFSQMRGRFNELNCSW